MKGRVLNMSVQSKSIYIVRQIMFIEHGGFTIDEEALFPSWNRAWRFLQSLTDPRSPDDFAEYYLLGRNEIIEVEPNAKNMEKHKWVFSLTGDLLEEYGRNGKPILNHCVCTKSIGNYAIGDLVEVLPEIKDFHSPLLRTTPAVVIPHEKLGFSCDKKTRSQEKASQHLYAVMYLTEKGIADHHHVMPCCLQPFESDLPERLRFLRVFSEYLKGDLKLPSELTETLLGGDMFLLNASVFDFARMKVRPPYHDKGKKPKTGNTRRR